MLAAALVLALTLTATAQPGKTKAPLGTWVREAGNAKIEFKFEEKTLKVSLKTADETITIETDYGIAKDGTVFGRIAKVDSSSGQGPEAGQLFSFKAKVGKGTLTISELSGTDNAQARQLIEGEYKLQPKGKEKDKD
jgi:hypothetical protein